ncbi:MAG: hypothetical protein H6730_30435 [Deltaproteobacteria bacterium]|nr:hypothetical protein [Deltaproteobacteria bacterium]
MGARVLLLGAGCASQGGLTKLDGSSTPASEARGTKVLVLMPDSPSALMALDGLRDELGADFAVTTRIVGEGAEPQAVAKAITETNPAVVVLMNNPTLRLYRRYQALRPSGARPLPVVALLTSFLKQSAGGIEDLSGVIYEVPLVTSLVNLRDLLAQPLVKVGVVHRPTFQGFVEEQKKLAAAEGFQVVGVEVGGKSSRDLRNAVDKLVEENKVDAIWVLNDNALLSRLMLERGWLPALRDKQTPVLVNVGSLLSRRVPFGTFGVLPDHRALGVQAANLVITAADGQAVAGTLEYPLSVEKVLDVSAARKSLRLHEDRIATVDRLLE